MIIDLLRPLLKWTNPQKAIKQNFNVLIAFFADAGLLIVLILAVTALYGEGLGGTGVIGGLAVVLAVLAGLSFACLLRIAARRYAEIEA